VLEHDFEPVSFLVDEQDSEVVEAEQVVQVAENLLLQQRDSRLEGHPGRGLDIEPHQLPAGQVDGVNLFLEPASARHIPHHDGRLTNPLADIADRCDGNLEMLIAPNVETELPVLLKLRRPPFTRGALAQHVRTGVPDANDQLVRVRSHDGVRPHQPAVDVDNAHALPDRLERRRRSPADRSSLDRGKFFRIDHDALERLAVERGQCLGA